MKLLLVILLASLGSQANAAYLKAGLGYNLGGKTNFEASGTSFGGDLKKDFIAPLLFAYGFEMTENVYGEIEAAYRKTKYDDSGASNQPTALTGAFNVVGNMPMENISLTGGIGALFGSFDPDGVGYKSGTAFGLQVFGGLDFNLTQNMKIGGELRHMTTITKASVGASSTNFDYSYNNTSLLVNLKLAM